MTDHRGPVKSLAPAALIAALAAAPVAAQQRTLPDGPHDAFPTASTFIETQLGFPRVTRARDDKKASLETKFDRLGIPFPPAGLYIRVFKVERIVEVWVQPSGVDRYRLFSTYPVCAVSGWLGPKRGQGDRQIPEGFYEVASFNPLSDYFLSLRVNYPNDADRLAGMTDNGLGGDIYLHGGCETVGCVPITDEHIKELYWLAVETRAAGVSRIPVHIFPTRLDDAGLDWLGSFFGGEPELMSFWKGMKAGYDYFQEKRRVPGVRAEPGGLYSVGDAAEMGMPEGLLGVPVTESVPLARVGGPAKDRLAKSAAGTTSSAAPGNAASSPARRKGKERPPVIFLGTAVDSAAAQGATGAADSAGMAAVDPPAGSATADTVGAAAEGARGDSTTAVLGVEKPGAEAGAPPGPDEASPDRSSVAAADQFPLAGVAAEDSVATVEEAEPGTRPQMRLLGRPRLLGTVLADGPSPGVYLLVPGSMPEGSERARHGIPVRVRLPRPVW